MKIDPLSQFSIKSLYPLSWGGFDVSFTNAAAHMVFGVVFVLGVLMFLTRSNHTVPSRGQMAAELLFQFLADMVKTYTGKEGLKYTPWVFSLFLFILTGNLLGLFPFAYTVTSQLIVTFTLACLVFFGVTLIGFFKHGLGFLRFFMPQGIPFYVAPLLVPVEIISYFSRPVSLSVRLFANMVAGHVMLKIFTAFAALLASGWLMPVAVFPVIITTALFLFELLVAVLQAYVFTILTCIYLNDALHLH